MINMGEKEYMQYFINIKNFLLSNQAKNFTAEKYADTVADCILKDLKKLQI